MTNLLTQECLNGFDGLVAAGFAIPVFPSSDQGYKLYGPGRLMLPAGTNYIKNPLPSHTANLIPGQWSTVAPTNATYEYSNGATHEDVVSKHIKITGAADVSVTCGMSLHSRSAEGVTAGDIVTISFSLGEVALTGCSLEMVCSCYKVDNASSGALTSAIAAPGAAFTRYSASFTMPALTTQFSVYLRAAGDFHDTDVMEYSICKVLVEKSAVLTPYFDGTYPDCAWSGAANASTSTRGESRLLTTLPAGCHQALTIAGRTVPLYAVTGATSERGFVTLGADAIFLEMSVAGQWKIVFGTTAGQAISAPCNFAAGTPHTFVARAVAGTSVDLMTDGVSAAQDVTSVPSPAAVTSLTVGGFNTAGYACDAYLRPLAISPYDIGASNAAYLDAGLTAGWGGLELFRFFRDRGYANTLILPLNGDSVGYTVGA